MLKLYYAPGSCSFASFIALEEAGADFEAIRLDFKSNDQQDPAYLKVNPKGRVPALATDQGILTETPAILTYIAHAFPEKKLAPLMTPLHSVSCRPSMRLFAPRSMSPMLIDFEATDGQTTKLPSRKWRAKPLK